MILNYHDTILRKKWWNILHFGLNKCSLYMFRDHVKKDKFGMCVIMMLIKKNWKLQEKSERFLHLQFFSQNPLVKIHQVTGYIYSNAKKKLKLLVFRCQ